MLVQVGFEIASGVVVRGSRSCSGSGTGCRSAAGRCSLPGQHLQLRHQLLHHADTTERNRATHTIEDDTSQSIAANLPRAIGSCGAPHWSCVMSPVHVSRDKASTSMQDRHRTKRRGARRPPCASVRVAATRRLDLASATPHRFFCLMSAQDAVREPTISVYI